MSWSLLALVAAVALAITPASAVGGELATDRILDTLRTPQIDAALRTLARTLQ